MEAMHQSKENTAAGLFWALSSTFPPTNLAESRMLLEPLTIEDRS